MLHDFEGHGDRSTLLAPLKLDRDSMPRLRTLRLRFEQIQVTLSSNIFSGLTTLEVRDALCWKTWEMPTLISCMREWTQLETLNLWWSLPEANITQYPVTRPKNTVTFPKLRRLDLGDMTLYADHFLRHLELHPGTSVHFDGEWHNGLHPADYSDVFRSLVSSISAEVLKPIRGLTIRNGSGDIEVYGFLESELELLGKAELGSGIRGSLYLFLQVDFDLDEEEVEVDLDVDPNEPRIQACQILSTISGVLSVRELEVLRVQLHNQPEFLEWEPILRPIDNVKKVIIDSHRIGTSRFLDALAGSTYESTDGWEPVLPRLEELVITFIIQYHDYDIPFDNVLQFHKSRLARGVPIQTLVLEDRRRRPATKDEVIEELARLSAVPGVDVVWKLEVDDD
ncbi:hypothetical protein EWM64_g1329 [Hericium alpestre]|uniref:F-box domain-containing protein n=1 Tax=Hericium alpestre TaxID=135208 RepID=A0A4Z0A8T3_9AGAM|nr:hypothetical protein EWM64_g1329 [Hericium alpestre]